MRHMPEKETKILQNKLGSWPNGMKLVESLFPLDSET
jgi:hypothetical protein